LAHPTRLKSAERTVPINSCRDQLIRKKSHYVRQRTEQHGNEADRCSQESGFHHLVWRNPALVQRFSGVEKMLETIAILLIVLWALGLVTSYTLGGFIHILIVIAVIMFLMRLIQGRRL